MSYRMSINNNDPELCIKMSPKMLQDLIARCEENGRNPNVEILMRIARSLECDLERDKSDEILSAIFSDNAIDHDALETSINCTSPYINNNKTIKTKF